MGDYPVAGRRQSQNIEDERPSMWNLLELLMAPEMRGMSVGRSGEMATSDPNGAPRLAPGLSDPTPTAFQGPLPGGMDARPKPRPGMNMEIVPRLMEGGGGREMGMGGGTGGDRLANRMVINESGVQDPAQERTKPATRPRWYDDVVAPEGSVNLGGRGGDNALPGAINQDRLNPGGAPLPEANPPMSAVGGNMARQLPARMQGASRNIPPPPALTDAISYSVGRTYGEGYSFQVRSGIIDEPRGASGASSSGRHIMDGPGAADVQIYAPDGHQLAGAELTPLAQNWVANYGSIGVNRRASDTSAYGWTHMDLVNEPGRGQNHTWAYGGWAEKGQRDAILGYAKTATWVDGLPADEVAIAIGEQADATRASSVRQAPPRDGRLASLFGRGDLPAPVEPPPAEARVASTDLAGDGGLRDPDMAPTTTAFAPVPRIQPDTLVGGTKGDVLTQSGDQSMSQRHPPSQPTETGDVAMLQGAPPLQASETGDRTMDQEPGGAPANPPVPRLRQDPLEAAILRDAFREPQRNVVGGAPYGVGAETAPPATASPSPIELTGVMAEAADRRPTPPAPRLRAGPALEKFQGELDSQILGRELGDQRKLMEGATARPTASATPPPTALPLGAEVGPGDEGDEVRRVQAAIAAAMPGGLIPDDINFVDGKYGPYTERVVRAIQEEAGVTIDGIVGDEETWPVIQAMIAGIPSPTARPEGGPGPYPAAEMANMAAVQPGVPRLNVVQPLDQGSTAPPPPVKGWGAPGLRPIERETNAEKMAHSYGRNWPTRSESRTKDDLTPAAVTPAAVTPATTSGRTGPPRIITSGQVAGLPRDMQNANWGETYEQDPTLLTNLGFFDAQPVRGRQPANLSLGAMPGSNALPHAGGTTMAASSLASSERTPPGWDYWTRDPGYDPLSSMQPVKPASLSAAPRLSTDAVTPAPTTVAPAVAPATSTGAPAAATPSSGGAATVYSGGGPTGSPAATSGPGPGAPGSTTASGTANTGSSGGGTPPSYYDASQGGWQSWNDSTQSYQSV